MTRIEIVAAFAAGVVGVALGAWLSRRNEKQAATERLLVEAVSDVVDGSAGVAQRVPDAQARYAAALARVALHGSPELVRAFRHHQEDATTITLEGRRRLVAAMQQARSELGRQPLDASDLESSAFWPAAFGRGTACLMMLAFTLIGSICAAAVAAALTHRWTSRRDQLNRRNDLRIQYLLAAYRALANASHRDLKPGSEGVRTFEDGIADIQLLGSQGQAEMAVAIGKALAESGEARLDVLLLSLRDDLREELKLEPLFQPPSHVRIVSSD